MALTDGERWTREELGRLRDGRFSPKAAASFLAAAQRRANETRRDRPRLAAQSRRWTAFGAAAWIGLAAVGAEPYRRRLCSGLAWWAVVGLMLDWHLGMFETEDGVPTELSTADAATLARAWLVPVIADDLKPLTLILALASDGLDGLLARSGRPTRAGRDLDGAVDACVLVAAMSAARRDRLIARPVLGLEATRLSAGIAYALGTYLLHSRAPRPSLTGAARGLVPFRFAGLVAASRRHRTFADALLASGSLAGLAVAGRAAASVKEADHEDDRKRCQGNEKEGHGHGQPA